MATAKTRILIYSDDSTVRESIRGALGKKLSDELPDNEIHAFATSDALHAYVDERGSEGRARADLIILDGEAVPEGGMGISRQLKDEVFECPPILLIVARADDAWLARWSRADTTLIHPIDPYTFAASAEAPILGATGVRTVEDTNLLPRPSQEQGRPRTKRIDNTFVTPPARSRKAPKLSHPNDAAAVATSLAMQALLSDKSPTLEPSLRPVFPL